MFCPRLHVAVSSGLLFQSNASDFSNFKHDHMGVSNIAPGNAFAEAITVVAKSALANLLRVRCVESVIL